MLQLDVRSFHFLRLHSHKVRFLELPQRRVVIEGFYKRDRCGGQAFGYISLMTGLEDFECCVENATEMGRQQLVHSYAIKHCMEGPAIVVNHRAEILSAIVNCELAFAKRVRQLPFSDFRSYLSMSGASTQNNNITERAAAVDIWMQYVREQPVVPHSPDVMSSLEYDVLLNRFVADYTMKVWHMRDRWRVWRQFDWGKLVVSFWCVSDVARCSDGWCCMHDRDTGEVVLCEKDHRFALDITSLVFAEGDSLVIFQEQGWLFSFRVMALEMTCAHDLTVANLFLPRLSHSVVVRILSFLQIIDRAYWSTPQIRNQLSTPD